VHDGLAATVNALATTVNASMPACRHAEGMRLSMFLAAATVTAGCAHPQAPGMNASTTPSEQAAQLRDGRQLTWAEWGDPQGRPAFFFHGGADSRLAAAVIDAPAREAGVRLIAPDRPGYGGSDPHPSGGLSTWPDDVFALADQLGIESFSVMGHSAGGPHALAIAADSHGRVDAVIVVCGAAPREAKGSGMGVPFRLNRWLAIRAPELNRKFLLSHRKSVYGDPEKFLRDWGRLSPPEGRLFRERPSIAQLIIDEMREGYRQGIDAAARENRALYEDWGFELGRVEVPVALYYGDADKMAPASWGRYLEAQLPFAQLHVVADEGHFSTLVETAPEILRHVR